MKRGSECMEQLQLDLFNEFDQYNPSSEEISYAKGICIKHIFEEHLLKYEIDKLYKSKISGNSMTFYQIEKLFSKNDNYKQYHKEFFDLCVKYLKIVDDYAWEYGINVYKDGIRFHTPKQQCIAYCMTMIPFEVFQYGIKEEWK